MYIFVLTLAFRSRSIKSWKIDKVHNSYWHGEVNRKFSGSFSVFHQFLLLFLLFFGEGKQQVAFWLQNWMTGIEKEREIVISNGIKEENIRININRPYISLFNIPYSYFLFFFHFYHFNSRFRWTGYYIIICVEVCFCFINNKYNTNGLAILLLLFPNLLHLFTQFWRSIELCASQPAIGMNGFFFADVLSVNSFAMTAENSHCETVKFILSREMVWISCHMDVRM